MRPAWLDKAIASAVSAKPEGSRWLLVDGDALAYTCGGAEAPGLAKARMLDLIAHAARISQASHTTVLLTGRGSDKGQRYKLARVKPYQGHRSSGRRPEQWEFLRRLLEADQLPNIPVLSTDKAEADDLFHMLSRLHGWDNSVIYTQDKDMRMVPGLHLSWSDFQLRPLRPDVFSVEYDGKVYGRKWFWLQMLMGDQADNVPGLPKATTAEGKQVLCGEVTAGKLLAGCKTNDDARAIVSMQYDAFYRTEDDPLAGQVAMLEQAVLLWMRVQPLDPFDVCAEGNPLAGLPSSVIAKIAERL